MLRLSKLADYGCQVMTYMACDKAIHSATEVASSLGLSVPTVSKILKMLVRNKLVVSVLGSKGGYSLARLPADISIAEVIGAMDGPISITECSSDTLCERESLCSTRSSWQGINRIIEDALGRVSLVDMSKPQSQVIDISGLNSRSASA
ncbi:MAG: SUF system Fe-S cluster assembly regulator [Gallionella sp.]